ncbi:hypothetical protein ACNQQN_24835 [Mycobacteroides chelonae]|uniref:hypothetical protein n=1 Tax=Mycobacteroides chelonae TaxID=1774 RepID=UPI003AAE09E4
MRPAATDPTIRVTSWTSGRETKYAYAAMPRLLTTRIPGVAAILPGTAFLEARDSMHQRRPHLVHRAHPSAHPITAQ